jgi:hypothetical protein
MIAQNLRLFGVENSSHPQGEADSCRNLFSFQLLTPTAVSRFNRSFKSNPFEGTPQQPGNRRCRLGLHLVSKDGPFASYIRR